MSKNNEFINRFNGHDKKKIKSFFDKLDNALKLNKKEKKKIINDFERYILYSLNNKKSISEILKLLPINSLFQYEKNNAWYPLDTSSKIYPLSMNDKWMSTYRLSYYLKENIIEEVLQLALDYTIIRFPLFKTSLHKGFFWHYLDDINKHFEISVEKELPCSSINISQSNRECFRVIYYQNRISCEFFHLLSDANGGLIFLTSLVNEYIRLLGKNVSYDRYAYNVHEKALIDEINDGFMKIKPEKDNGKLVEKSALSIDGKLSNIEPCQVIHFDLDSNKVYELAKKNNVTINELLLAFLFLVISYSTSRNGEIKIQVPIDLRRMYNINTLRNFSLYNTISIAKSDINNFESLLNEVRKQSREKLSMKAINSVMYEACKLVNSLRLIPLFIKRPIANFIYRYFGDRASTTVLSNIGRVDLSSELASNIIKADFCLGTTLTNKVLFSVITVNNILTLTITKFTTNTSIENNLYNLLKDYNLIINVHGSDKYEN